MVSIGAGASPLIGAQSRPLSSMVSSASESGAAQHSAAAEGFDAGVSFRRRSTCQALADSQKSIFRALTPLVGEQRRPFFKLLSAQQLEARFGTRKDIYAGADRSLWWQCWNGVGADLPANGGGGRASRWRA